MSRLHPFDLAFGDLVAERFPALGREAGGAELDIAGFARLPGVRSLLQLLLGEGDGAAPETIEGYVVNLYAAFRYWAAGRHTVAVPREALERLIETPDPSPAPVPAGACYLSFPERWFWARIREDTPPEPLDGMFVAGPVDLHGPMTVVAILGMRPGRDGFSQLTATADAAELRAAAHAVGDPPFAAAIEGGAAAGVRSITTEGELLHLAHLALQSVRE